MTSGNLIIPVLVRLCKYSLHDDDEGEDDNDDLSQCGLIIALQYLAQFPFHPQCVWDIENYFFQVHFNFILCLFLLPAQKQIATNTCHKKQVFKADRKTFGLGLCTPNCVRFANSYGNNTTLITICAHGIPGSYEEEITYYQLHFKYIFLWHDVMSVVF